MKIGITGRRQNALARKTALRALKILEGKGADFEADIGFLPKAKNAKKFSKFNSGIIISFGGDGTLLEVCRNLRKKIPVIGINCGRRGFLQAFRHDELEHAIDSVLHKKYTIEKRTRILAKVDGRVAGEALNEVLVVPAKAGRLLRYKLNIGGGKRDETGDGLIVATPTGSTAHSLSAGGPIVKGNAAVFVVVSMNPVDWKHRPLIINDHEKIVVSHFRKISAEAIIDGQKRFLVKSRVEILKGRGVLLAVAKN